MIPMQYEVMQVKLNKILPKHNNKTESKPFQKIVWQIWICAICLINMIERFVPKFQCDYQIKSISHNYIVLRFKNDLISCNYTISGFTAAYCTYTVQDTHSKAVIGLYVAHKHQVRIYPII